MKQNALTPLDQDDYTSIEAAVMETARGRWFLAEYAKRNRNADTDVILGAIGRLEQAMTGERALQDMERVKFDLVEMAKAIARTKVEIASLRPNGESVTHFEEATEALDAIVRTTERATSEILECAEKIQEAAWTLREHNAEYEQCDVLDRRATEIYTACSFQDLTAQRITKVVQTLRYLEGRINAMIDVWAPETATDIAPDMSSSSPAQARATEIDPDLRQDDVDLVIMDGADAHATDVAAGEMPRMAAPVIQMDVEVPSAITDDLGDVAFADVAGLAGDEALFSDAETQIIDTESVAEPSEPGIAIINDDLTMRGRSPLDGAVVFDGAADDTPGIAEAHDPLAELDAMEPVEKLRRFT